MVKVAIAGGAGNFGRAVIDALLASPNQTHEIVLLSRQDAPTDSPFSSSSSPTGSSVKWVKTDYSTASLTSILTTHSIHTVLSFIVVHMDPDNASQRNLIDACVASPTVKRFAPSEWVGPKFDGIPWYAGKQVIRDYLEQINADKKVLEYCLFQQGMLVDYMAWPHRHPESVHVVPVETPIEFHTKRALVLDEENARITFTTSKDLAQVVALAVEWDETKEWPRIGGIKGWEGTLGEVIAMGEKIRGAPFQVEKLAAEDLKQGVLKGSWKPKLEHPSYTAEEAEAFASALACGVILGYGTGCMNTSDEWNRLLPDYKFKSAEQFLREVWEGKA